MNTILPYFRLDADPLWQSMPDADKNPLPASLFEERAQSLRAKLDGPVGFYHWPSRLPPDYLQRVNQIATELRSEFEGAVIFGIGGSFLGPATIVEALSAERTTEGRKPFPLLWLSNSDAPEIRRIEKAIHGKKFAAIVISKSGNTVETLSAFFT